MKTSKLFLASMVLITLACLSTVQGQYATTNTYSSSTSTAGSTSSATSQYGQYYPMPAEQTSYMVPAVSQVPTDLVGTVLSIRDENSMYVNFTKSNIPGMEGATLVLFPQPVPIKDLIYFQGKELSFSLLGHDILGRPVCDAYFDGIPIIDYLKRYETYGNYAPGYGYYSPRYGNYSPRHGYYSSGSLQISEST